MGLVRAIRAISALGVWTARLGARFPIPSSELWVLNKALGCTFSKSPRQLRSGTSTWQIFRVNPEPTPQAGCPGDALAGVEREVVAERSLCVPVPELV